MIKETPDYLKLAFPAIAGKVSFLFKKSRESSGENVSFTGQIIAGLFCLRYTGKVFFILSMLSNFLAAVEQFVKIYATEVPLEWFVFIGSFFEEVISLIPSPLIMTTAGSLAFIDGRSLGYLFLLALIGNLGKTLGAWVYYVVGDRLEDMLIKPLTRFFGLKHEEIENFGKRFTGHHWKDGGVLFLLRAIPFFPALPVSLAAGVIKMDVRVFLVATYGGNFFKDLFYLYAGYAGLAKLHAVWREMEPIRIGIDILILLVVVIVLVFLYMHQGNGQRFAAYGKKYVARLMRKIGRNKR